MFSAHDTGKGWHALAAVRTLEPAQNLAGLRVDAAAPNRRDVVLWPPQQAIWSPPDCPQTPPVTSVLPGGGGVASSAVPIGIRLWDAEGNPSHPELQYQLPNSTAWVNATIAQLDGTNYSPALKGAAAPTGSDHTLIWNASAVFTTAQTNLFFRARATDLSLTGEWSPPVEYLLVSGSDGDNMPDAWEMQYFGSTARNGLGDYDGDGFIDEAEYYADTIPTDLTSYLRVTTVTLETGGVQITWKGGVQARQTLEKTYGLGGTNTWFNLQTWNPPTPVTRTFVDPYGTNREVFYRIRAQRF